MNMKFKMTDCNKSPRCAGERNLSSLKDRVTMANLVFGHMNRGEACTTPTL